MTGRQGAVVVSLVLIEPWAPECFGGQNRVPAPPEYNGLVLSISLKNTGCADTVPFQPKPETPRSDSANLETSEPSEPYSAPKFWSPPGRNARRTARGRPLARCTGCARNGTCTTLWVSTRILG